MEYIEEELNRIKGIRDLVDDVIQTSILELEDQIRATIKARWKRGESVTGGNITNTNNGSSVYAQLSYKALKLTLNPSAGGHVDLTYTGSLGDKIELVKLSDGNYEIISTDFKYGEIGDKYGFDEFGLSSDEMEFFMKELEKKINFKIQ